MHGTETKAPASAIWALGATQILGYGTLYFSFGVLAPDMAEDFAVPRQWVFGALSLALFLGSLLAPTAGRLADRHGAARVMAFGSGVVALSLAACAVAPGRLSFAAALIVMELASSFVLYAAAFVAVVQIGPIGAQRSITHLTLIAGFSSTLFWPLTSLLHDYLDWRDVYLVFAAANLLICLPIHAWLARTTARRRPPAHATAPSAAVASAQSSAKPPRMRTVFLLMMAGFAVEGFIVSAVLLHMLPLLTALGLGTAGVAASTLFGPAQVASRLINMVFGGRLRQSALAIIAAALVAAALATLVASAPMAVGIAAFVVLFGLGSGLTSIVGGTLPLEVFGRNGYGRNVGYMSGARQFMSAFAPFAFAMMMSGLTIPGALVVLCCIAVLGIVVFAAVSALANPVLA